MIVACTNTCTMLANFRIWDSEAKKQEIWGMDMVMLGGKAITRSLKQILSLTVFEIICCVPLIFIVLCGVLLFRHFEKYFYFLFHLGTLFFSLWILYYISHPKLVLKGFSSSVACPPLFILLSFLFTAAEELYVFPIKNEILWKTKLMQLSVPWP